MPAPFGPITATSSPRPAERETPRSATLSPYRLTRSRAAIVVAVAVSTAPRLAESPAVKLLFVGDVVGGIGRRTLSELLPGLRERHRPDFVVVNGENAAGGIGITRKTAREMLDAGVDAITLGNHAYRHREVYDYLDQRAADRAARQLPEGEPRAGAHGGGVRTACAWRW